MYRPTLLKHSGRLQRRVLKKCWKGLTAGSLIVTAMSIQRRKEKEEFGLAWASTTSRNGWSGRTNAILFWRCHAPSMVYEGLRVLRSPGMRRIGFLWA